MINALMNDHLKIIADHYLTNKEIYSVERALNDLIKLTTDENYMDIVRYINNHINTTHELDLTMYIVEIASIKTPGLEVIIQEKLKTYTDKDAIEDLQEALIKINLQN